MTEALKVKDTERLTISLMDKDDAELLWELDQDPEVMKYINGGKISSREDIVEIMLPRMYKYRNPEKGWGLWKVIVKESDEFIGWVLVRPMEFFSDEPEYHNLEIGWRLMQKSWGKGYGTEAARAVMDALVEKGGITHLSAIAMVENAGSINIMKKLGLEYVKTYTHESDFGSFETDYYSIKI